MRVERPTSVIVIAIFQLIFGGLGLMCNLCAGIVLLAGGPQAFQFAGAGPNPGTTLQEEMEKFQSEKLPQAKAVQAVGFVTSLLFALMMVASGIGLLKMQPWARTLAIVYAIAGIANALFTTIYALMYTAPMMREFIALKKSQGNLKPQETITINALELSTNLAGYSPLLFLVYPIIVLIILLRPKIGAAFRGELVGPPEEIEDYRDDSREFDDR